MTNPIFFNGWPYNPGPITQIQPFTYGDGVTFADLLYGLKNYVKNEIVPMINSFPETVDKAIHDLVIAVDAALAAQTQLVDTKLAAQDAENDQKIADLTQYVNDKIDEILNASVEIQDAVTRQIFQNPASQTRVVTDALYAAKSIEAVVTQHTGDIAALDGRVDALEASDSAQGVALTDLDNRVGVVEGDLSSRLSTTTLDMRYTRREINPLAVFFGSSNVTPGTWTEEFCTMMGYTGRNYAIGGGSFTGAGAGTFASQIATANADSTLDKAAVSYVFLADAGNDMRAQGTEANFRTYANTALNSLRSVFPNARIIIIPALWGITPNITLGNLEMGAIRALTQFSQTLKDLGLTYNMEVVENTQLWHWDTTAWMKPGEVHYTAAGYSRVARMMRDYMKTGDSPLMGVGIGPVQAKPNVDSSNILASREGNYVRISGSFNPSQTIPIDADLFQLPEGIFPYYTAQVPVINSTTRGVDQVATVFGAGNFRGLVRSFSAIPATQGYYINAVLPAF